ncbi:BBE domain-containing protein [Nocardia vinacea]|uniref:BBE domain-containing protein n=1 Tax=Nocardia vinacea TaxID=96468 RepID=UPI003AF3431C
MQVRAPRIGRRALDRECEYYGADREWLRQVKARYVPENVFSFEQSVPLSSESTV